MTTVLDTPALSRVEDAGLNASATPRQHWLDGWIVRTHPGKARRSRCINAVAPGRLPLAERLLRARALYDEAGLPLLVRITPFSQPADLDVQLADAGWQRLDPTQVLIATALPSPDVLGRPLPAPLVGLRLDPDEFATAVGNLRGSSAQDRAAHAERLRLCPVRHHGVALTDAGGQVVACAQSAREGSSVGLYDVHTLASHRGQGLARLLCERLLSQAASEGAKVGYLQVEADNAPAQAVYRRLGFVDGYGYHYRQPPASGA